MALSSGCNPAVEEAAAETKSANPGSDATLVQVAPVVAGELEDEWIYRGEVKAQNETVLAAGEAGLVSELSVRVGDRVEAGAPLARLDASLLRPQLERAVAQRAEVSEKLAQARRDFERVKGVEGSFVPKSDVEQARARLMALEQQERGSAATVQEVRARLGRHKVDAPFSGVVRRRMANPGEWVHAGDPLVELVSLDDVEVVVDVPPEVLAKVSLGSSAHVVGDDEVELEVKGIVPALDSDTRTARLRLEPSAGSKLLVGNVVRVSFSVAHSGAGLLVPRDAVVRTPRGTTVVRVTDGKADPQPVRILASAGDKVLVASKELRAGDPVVIRGNERLRPDTPVRTK